MPKHLRTPLTAEMVADLHIGETVLLSGVIYTGRDAAHKRLCDLLAEGKPLPIDVEGQVIYYVGPAPAKPGQPIGSAGPTTSYRMDAYAPKLIAIGLKGMIGKGARNADVVNAMKEHKAVYFAATGGAGALLAKKVVSSTIVAYEDLGAEAIRRLEVKELPLIVAQDCFGENLYDVGVAKYRKAVS